MEKTITPLSTQKFSFGTHTSTEGGATFRGAVISGRDMAFDPNSGTPVSGHIEKIEFQTQTNDQSAIIHGIFDGINANVEALNDAFATAQTPWFDPANFFDAEILDDAFSVIVPVPSPVAAPSGALVLETGDILTAKELSDIYCARDLDGTPQNGTSDAPSPHPSLDVLIDLPSHNDFYDIDTEAEEDEPFLCII